MSVGLLGLLDDVAGLAKVAAASVDDVAGMAAKAGLKATGAVIDDAAVTPSYVHGFSADREFPIVVRIAKGSLRNKLLFLLPAALLLSLFLPWAITPLLMLGAAYLCYEGAEKVYHALMPHSAEHHEESLAPTPLSPQALEDQKVGNAIKTDFILSAEIMTIALAELPDQDLLSQAMVLLVVAFGITLAVYGVVALIVKADDFGLSLANDTGHSAASQARRSFGIALVRSVPVFMSVLSVVGTAAMLWVGGGIIIHGLEGYGLGAIGHAIHDWGHAAAEAVPALGALLNWMVESAAYGVFGLVLGALLIPVAGYLIAPAWRNLQAVLGRRKARA